MNAAELAIKLIAAKKEEAEANAKRVAIESQIIELLGVKEEGSQTHDLENGLKVTITGKLTYSTDINKLIDLSQKLPENLRPIKVETKADDTGLKYLRREVPEAWKIIAPAVSIKPAKPSVSIKA